MHLRQLSVKSSVQVVVLGMGMQSVRKAETATAQDAYTAPHSLIKPCTITIMCLPKSSIEPSELQSSLLQQLYYTIEETLNSTSSPLQHAKRQKTRHITR
jgi:hypothetical protein